MKKGYKRAAIVFVLTIIVTGLAALGGERLETATEAVQMVSEKVLVPGGQSVGIKMDVKGVLVVGLEEIETEEAVVNPGYEAGLQIGDIILSVNGKEVLYAKDVAAEVNKGKSEHPDNPLEIKVMRKEDILEFLIYPARDKTSGQYKIGIWVKEKIAGIGTLTFYDPATNVFAALGHGIYENQTGTLLGAGSGQLLRTEVKSVQEGKTGVPGEIRGIFYGNEDPIGSVLMNSRFGIYSEGKDFSDFQLAQPVAVGFEDRVKTGPAYILTTIDGDKVEKFSINITKVSRQKTADSKSMEIEVTDEKLLRRCGGIVQGMSGSPIIQNNRIIGAVTHVLVDDPTRGYGIYIRWMLNECEKNREL